MRIEAAAKGKVQDLRDTVKNILVRLTASTFRISLKLKMVLSEKEHVLTCFVPLHSWCAP